MRPLKLIAGLALLPFCWAATRTLGGLIASVRPASFAGVPDTAWALGIGFALWVGLYYTSSRPVRAYVLGHELTHALWGVLMGARVRRLKVSGDGGSVQLSKTNFLITLAPYFFPFYTVLLMALHGVLALFFDLTPWRLLFLALVGLTWAFHLTFTLSMLRTHQSDIRENGRLFSFSVIYLLNVLGLGLWIIIVGTPSIEEGARRWEQDLRATWRGLTGVIPAVADRLGEVKAEAAGTTQ